MKHSMEAFNEGYKKLNDAQKLAVDTVEGPVLVIAGPGTGKTHILTLRIANILLKTDASPENILALTFTDSAARTVARRLRTLIGDEAARKVGVFTFHGFAGDVLRRHPEAFPEVSARRLMGEVEQVLLWRSVFENAGETALATPKSPFHSLKDVKSLEDTFTRECFSLADYETWLTEEAERLKDDPKLVYARDGKEHVAGDLNAAGTKRLERLYKGREAARLVSAYRAEKEARGVYDYTDVLRIVADALFADEALRADLQERYQYVLADEHQDANALQHALLDALSYDEHPNLFIVGDEKQAVFGFQGADVTHFRTFTERYPRTAIITLEENYRSYQEILDISHSLLSELSAMSGDHIRLTSSRGKGGKISLLEATDALAERDQVATLIEAAIREGVPPHEIAVLVAKNRTADLFALQLRARGISTLRAGNIDLEGRPSVRFLLSLMHAVADGNDIAHLREALLAPWWEESFPCRVRFLRQTGDREFLERLSRELPRIAGVLDELSRQAVSMPPLSLFSSLLTATGARAYFLGSVAGVDEDIPLVRQVMMHIEELARREPNATFAELMSEFTKAREHEIGNIKTSLTQKEGCVTVITAHKAKGMEFSRVFVAALTQGEWESKGRAAVVPSPFTASREREELVRLFYVALTRAKDELVLSCPLADAEGKEQAPMSLLPPELPLIEVTDNPLPQLHVVRDAPALVRELTLSYLQTEGLSPSAFNEYLESPPTFFARRVLKLREPESRAIVLGNAVHGAVAAYLRLPGTPEEERRQAAFTELAGGFKRSLLPRGDAFSQLEQQGQRCLSAYLESAFQARKASVIEETFSVHRQVAGTEVLLKGKVDAVFEDEAGLCIVDFKTSSVIQKSDKEKFERQLAFYDLLLRANSHETTSALIVQIGDDVKEHPVALTSETRASLNRELEEVLTELVSGKWRASETTSEYDALLNLFT